MKYFRFLAVSVAACAGFFILPASASILLFPQNSSGVLDQSYGDQVSAATSGGDVYGFGGVGWTPNVSVEYTGSALRTSRSGYGNLTGALWNSTAGEDLGVTFTAETGYDAALYSFDIGVYGSSDMVIENITFLDGAGNILASISDLLIEAGKTRTSVDLAVLFGGPLVESTISILFDISDYGSRSDNFGFDNFTFGQLAWDGWDENVLETPLPAGLPLFLSGIAGLGWLKRRRKTKTA